MNAEEKLRAMSAFESCLLGERQLDYVLKSAGEGRCKKFYVSSKGIDYAWTAKFKSKDDAVDGFFERWRESWENFSTKFSCLMPSQKIPETFSELALRLAVLGISC